MENGGTTLTTVYLGAAEYENTVLKRVLKAEGNFDVVGSTFTYQYILKYHLGNASVVCTAAEMKAVKTCLMVECTRPAGLANCQPVAAPKGVRLKMKTVKWP